MTLIRFLFSLLLSFVSLAKTTEYWRTPRHTPLTHSLHPLLLTSKKIRRCCSDLFHDRTILEHQERKFFLCTLEYWTRSMQIRQWTEITFKILNPWLTSRYKGQPWASVFEFTLTETHCTHLKGHNSYCYSATPNQTHHLDDSINTFFGLSGRATGGTRGGRRRLRRWHSFSFKPSSTHVDSR